MKNHLSLSHRLLQHLQEHGWIPEGDIEASGGGGFRRRGKYAHVVLRVARQARGRELVALLADAHLVAKARGLAVSKGAIPVAVVGVPRLSSSMLELLKAYANEHLAEEAWGVVEADGPPRIFGLWKDVVLPPEVRRVVRENREDWAIAGRSNAYTDLGLWMFKCLLASRIPEEWLRAPRPVIWNQSHLAEVAGVSIASAHRWASVMKASGFLISGEEGFELVRLPELLRNWGAVMQANEPKEVPARFLLPGSDPEAALARLCRQADDEEICLGLFLACERLGLSVVSGAPRHLYLPEPSKAKLEELGLIPCGPGEPADLLVRRPSFPMAVFQAAVRPPGFPPVADVVQCWLDLRHHPVRGREQAEAIARRLGWDL